MNAINKTTIDPFAPELIARFLKELDDLEIKHSLKGTLNIFEVAGLGRQEIKNSRMLQFLLTPSNPHGLGAEVLKGLVVPHFNRIQHPANCLQIRPTQFLLDNLSDVVIVPEWKHIDVLIYCDRLRFVIAIENKIDAKESERDGVSQLGRYASKLESDPKFSQYSKLFFFLTVDGVEPSEKGWVAITHNHVLSCIRKSYDDAQRYSTMSPDAKFFVKHYIDFLERNIVINQILEEDCRQIYQQHTKILDMIISYAASGAGVSQYAIEFTEKIGASIVTNTPNRMAYLPKDLMDLLPDDTIEISWWGQSKPIMFWFQIDVNNRLKLVLQVGPMKDRDIRQKFVSTLFKIFKVKNRTITDKYSTIISPTVIMTEESDVLEQMIGLYRQVEIHLDALKLMLKSFDFSKLDLDEMPLEIKS